MRYEVEQQIYEIDNAIFLLNLLNEPNMENPTKAELTESLKMANSCMKLMMRELAKKDITLKELNEDLRGEDNAHTITEKLEDMSKDIDKMNEVLDKSIEENEIGKN